MKDENLRHENASGRDERRMEGCLWISLGRSAFFFPFNFPIVGFFFLGAGPPVSDPSFFFSFLKGITQY